MNKIKVKGLLVQVNVIQNRDQFNSTGIQLRFKTELQDQTISRTFHFPKRFKANCLIYKQLSKMGLLIFEKLHNKPFLLASAIEEVALYQSFELLITESGKDNYPYNIENISSLKSNINNNLSVSTQV